MNEIINTLLNMLLEHAGEIGVAAFGLLVAWIKRKLDLDKMEKRAVENGITDKKMIETIIGKRIKLKIRG